MQLDALVFYASDGRQRVIEFRPGQLNILTGDSRTGKSSLINIIRYCLGAESPHTPRGVIRQSIAWYGLLAHVGDSHFFVGRPAPDGDSTTAAMLLVGATEPPPFDELDSRGATTDGIRDYLGGLLGIEENVNVPPTGHSRLPLAATFVHALYYCFQGQGEIANPDLLFHHQNRDFQKQTIKDTLPYFLGAFGLEELRMRGELTERRRELRLATAKLREANAERAHGVNRASSLIAEARELSLLEAGDDPSDLPSARALLQIAADAPSRPVDIADNVGGEFRRLRARRADIAQQLREIADQVRGLDDFARIGGEYADELNEQRSRLASIRLIPNSRAEDATCPVCDRPLAEHVTNVREEVESALGLVEKRLRQTARDHPRIEAAREELRESQAKTRADLVEVDQSLAALASAEEAVSRARDSLNLQSYVRGRISQYLETSQVTEDTELSQLTARVKALEAQVQNLVEKLDPDELRSKVESIMARINRSVTAIAKELSLEHAQTGVRIDLDRLTIVADTDDGAAYLDRGEIGSGMNWVGYHLAVYLALQRFFIASNRPVPSFVVLDQPSQAFFPSDRTRGGDLEELEDSDRRNTKRLYALLHETAEALGGRLQIIALDHADFDEQWFQDCVVERWRNGKALIPRTWLSPEMHLAEVQARLEDDAEFRDALEAMAASWLDELDLTQTEIRALTSPTDASIENETILSIDAIEHVRAVDVAETGDADFVSIDLHIDAVVTISFTTDAGGLEWLNEEHHDIQIDVIEETFAQGSTLPRGVTAKYRATYSTDSGTLVDAELIGAYDASTDSDAG
jgi:hypothetical protein